MIVAEANARETDTTEAANFIKFTADYWNNVLSPQIEQLRVGTKNKLTALDESATVQQAVTIAYNAIQQLKAI
jgi:hypothetical protein